MSKLQAFISGASRQAALIGQEFVLGQEIVLDTIFSNSRTISHTSLWSIYFNKGTCRGLDT
jgi:hypothetical protein